MAAEWIEVGVVLDPLKLLTGLRENAFQQIERRIGIAQIGACASHVVLGQDIIRFDDQGARDPFSGALLFTQGDKCGEAEVSRPGILGMKGHLAFA